MPRPESPKLIPKPTIQPFILDTESEIKLANALGFNNLPTDPDVIGAIRHMIACYKATESGSKSTTIANIIIALRNLEKEGRVYSETIELLAFNNSGVDYITHNLLQPLAIEVSEGVSQWNQRGVILF